MTGPLILMSLGAALIVVHLIGRRQGLHSPADRRAALRLLWDLTIGALALFIFSSWMLAPRHVLPGQRIPRPKARRMVQAMSSDDARKLID